MKESEELIAAIAVAETAYRNILKTKDPNAPKSKIPQRIH